MPFGSLPVYLAALAALIAFVVHLVVIIAVLLTRRRDPSTTLAWILFIAAMPIIGVIVYLALGRTQIRRAIRRVERIEARLRAVFSRFDLQQQFLDNKTDTLDIRTKMQIRLGNALASTPATSGNTTRVLVNAAVTYQEITTAIAQAKHHIHIQFYIIRPDVIGIALRDQLAKKAAEGVDVRVLVDALGSAALPAEFWKPLISAGGKAEPFAPLIGPLPRLRRRDRVDFRNHRKIVVIDSSVGFTGGINVGREYLGLNPNIGRWRDTHVRIEGPAVLSLQHAFFQDWLMTTGETFDDERYFSSTCTEGDCSVQIIDSGPDRNFPTMELYQAQAIALSQRRVWITNPYFIPSQSIESALTSAALRGIDVRLLLPHNSDSRLVTLASRSYYENLLHSGVRIFEYAKGFVHAKTMLIDDWVATVGSANMDMRSFNLNYELNAFVFEAKTCSDLASHFERDLVAAREVTLESIRRATFLVRLIRALARLLSPML